MAERIIRIQGSASPTPIPLPQPSQPAAQPQPAMGNPAPRAGLASSPLPANCAESLRLLIGKISEIRTVDADHVDQAFELLVLLHAHRHAIDAAIQSHSKHEVFGRFISKLNPFLRDFALAVAQGQVDLSLLENVETIGLALTACTSLNGKSAINATGRKALPTLVETLLLQVNGKLAAQASKHPDQALSIQNMLTRLLKSHQFQPTDVVRAACRDTLKLYASWSEQEDAHAIDLGKCAVQAEMLCNGEFNLLDLHDSEVMQWLQDLVQWLSSAPSCARLYQSPFDPVPLSNVCNFVCFLLENRLLKLNDANLPGMLDRLLSPASKQSAIELMHGDTRPMAALCHLIFRLIRLKIDNSMSKAIAQRCATSCATLLSLCRHGVFRTHPAFSHDLTKLLWLINGVHAWGQRSEHKSLKSCLPGDSDLASIAAILLERLSHRGILRPSDSGPAHSALEFLCWAKKEKLMTASQSDKALLDLLAAFTEQASCWNEECCQSMLMFLTQLDHAGLDQKAMRAARAALHHKKASSEQDMEEEFTPRRRVMQTVDITLALAPEDELDQEISPRRECATRGAIPGDTRIIPSAPSSPDTWPAAAPVVVTRKVHQTKRRISPDSRTLAALAALSEPALDRKTGRETDSDEEGSRPNTTTTTTTATTTTTTTTRTTRSTETTASGAQVRHKKTSGKSQPQAQSEWLDSDPQPSRTPLPSTASMDLLTIEAKVKIWTDKFGKLGEYGRDGEQVIPGTTANKASKANTTSTTNITTTTAPTTSPGNSQTPAVEQLLRRLTTVQHSKLLEYLASDNAGKLAETLAQPNSPAVIQHRDADQRTVLQIAIAREAWQGVQLLLAREDVRSQAHLADKRGNTPLIVAAWHGHIGTLQALLAIPAVAQGLLTQRKRMSWPDFVKRVTAWPCWTKRKSWD
jgi:hypothetical protein